MRRRLLLLAAWLVAGFITAITALPWWLGPVLGWAGRSRGATFGAYDRIGYSRFALHDLTVRRAGVTITVSRIEADTPLLWLWRSWTGQPGELLAGHWTVRVESRNGGELKPPATTVGNGGWLPLRATLIHLAAMFDRWLPRARAAAGSVQWPGGALTLASATWQGHLLAAENVTVGSLHANATLALPAGTDTMRFTARTIDGHVTAGLESRGADVTGIVTWWEQRAALNAHFGGTAWLPATAALQADAWQVPGARLKLGELYAFVRGHGTIEWRDGHFEADAAATGEPLAGKLAPPLEAAVRGHGDAQSFTVETLHATLPGITAALSESVTLDRQGRFKTSAARFTVEADLAKQPWFVAKGTVSGGAGLVAGVAQSPVVDFNLEARDVAVGDIALGTATARGRFDWPRMEITAGTIVPAENGEIAWHGGWDFRTKEIFRAAVAGQIRRAAIARWLPAHPDFETIAVKVEASGPLARLTHAGSAQADGVKLPGLNPLALAITWRGHGDRIEDFTAEATAGTTVISAAGAATRTEMRLTGLTLAKGGATHLKLTAPAIVKWSPAAQVDGLQLAGDGDVGAAVTWGETGRVEFTVHKVLSAWFEDLAPLPGPAWQLNSLAMSGAWDRGPMAFSVAGEAAIALGDRRSAVVTVEAKGDKDGLRVEALRATEGTTTIVTATGQVPVVFFPAAAPRMRIEPKGALLIEAATESNATFWEKFTELTGLELKEPQASAHVTGTWAQPLGEIRVKAAHVAMDAARFKRPLPAMTSLDLALTGDRGGIKLETFSARIEGQAVRAEGRLPVTGGGWDEFRKAPLAFALRGTELHLEVADAGLAAFAGFLPAYLAPKGRLQVDLNYRGGGAVAGFVRLQDGASRRLGPLGVLQEINADAQVSGRTLELRTVTATAGGRPVTLSGSVEFPAGAEPRYAVELHGENLPFMRQTGLIVRGDLDLKLHTPAIGPTILSGAVRLRDSLFLSDVRAFLPGGTKGGVRVPPYFAVAAPPLGAWALSVDVGGERFMRLRTPVFNGVASARFRLGGTLAEPRLIGEVVIDEGQILMPFASFAVKQGTLRITEDRPHELALFLRGTGRRNDYELTMEITGTAAAPSIVFTSSPALDSGPLLLMVMTGAAPSSEIAFTSTQRFARFGTYLGQTLLGSFGGDATSADRLSIASGEKVSRQGRETYDVEYKLADRWKWVGEYDEFDDYNIGLKWRIYPGKRAAEAPPDAPH